MEPSPNTKQKLGLTKFMRSNENGAALIIGLMFLVILALAGTTAVLLTSTDLQISSNYKAGEKALYVAEAGAQEARERLRLKPDTDPAYAYIVNDGHMDAAQWSAYIGSEAESQKKGYDSTNSMHTRVASLQSDMDYTVVIAHQVDKSGNVLYWGDSDEDGDFERHTNAAKNDPNIYLITSYGNAEGGCKVVQMEVTRVPPIAIKGALYTGIGARLTGSVEIDGIDKCGVSSISSKPGIATPLPFIDSNTPIEPPSKPEAVTGSEGKIPDVRYDVAPINVKPIVDSLKKSAEFSYPGGGTDTGDTKPGPGDGWGTPDLDAAPPACSTCSIVYYASNIKLSGTVEGCGILLVDGDLELSGTLDWYGTVVVAGSLKCSGVVKIRGAMLTDDDTNIDQLKGNVDLAYCSSATENQNKYYPLTVLSWKQDLSE